MAIIRFLILFTISINLWANTHSFNWYSMDAQEKVTLNIELFLSSTCPHCQKEDVFFKDLEAKEPWLTIHRNYINEDKQALILFNQFLREQQANDFAVPSAFFCNSRWVGFESVETTGKDLLKALHYCKQQIEEKGSLTQPTIDVLKRLGNANMYNTGLTEQPTNFHYLMLVVFLDIINPCALFGLITFFALLFIQYSKRNQLITGLLFILAIALVHWVQQTSMNTFYQIVPWLRILAVFLGLFTLYIASLYYKKRAPKPSLLFSWAFFFALIVYSYQQICVMNWSYIFQQWLLNKHLATGQYILLQALYQFLYIAPLILLLIGYLFLSSYPWAQLIKPFLVRTGLLFISFFALFLIIQPTFLANHSLSYLVLLFVPLIGALMSWYEERYKKIK